MNKTTIKHKKVRTKKDLLESPYVEDVFSEGEGEWWVHLYTEYKSVRMECSMLHEGTIKELCDAFNEGIYKSN